MEYEENMKYWLWLVMVFGVANTKTLELLQMYDTCREMYYVLHDPDCGVLNERERSNVRRVRLEQAESIIEYCKQQKIGIITWESEIYPEALRQIYNPPAVLFYRGDPGLLHDTMLLTVVGTRRPSPYSLRVADWLCRDLARCNIVLASGCAVGLDAAAHKAAIAEGSPTIAVLGCGVDYDYPKENRAMKEQIVANGLLLSEYFPGTQPYPGNFPVRNRILSGISEGVLVLEAGARSGALITANLACEQGRHVFCVPPADLFDKRYSGVMNFLRDGAYPVFSYLDVLYTYYLEYPHKLSLFDEDGISRTQDSLLFQEPAVPQRKRAKPASAVSAGKTAGTYTMPEDASPVQQQVLAMLQKGGQRMDAICCMLNRSFEDTTVLMLEMEMLGWVVNSDRDFFALPETE
jgi:DNA processing protein